MKPSIGCEAANGSCTTVLLFTLCGRVTGTVMWVMCLVIMPPPLIGGALSDAFI